LSETSPPRPLFIDAALSRDLETAEAESSRAFCEAAATLYPDAPICVYEVGGVGGGYGLHYGPSDPLNAVKGVGLNGPVDMGAWDALEHGFRAAGSPVVIDLSPFADETFVSLLSSRGYTIGSFETVMCRRLDDGGAAPIPSLAGGITIEQVASERAREWSRMLDVGFADGGEPMKFAVDFGLVRQNLPRSVMLLACVDGVPAGGAGVSIHGHVAHMAGAAVLPQFRGRGIQQQLTAWRLRLARERGCTLAKLDVRAGSGSYRNAARAGFHVAYTRPQLMRCWA
jgi:ribosomal protein S18 acetylase RimI-like enzyme